MGCVGSVVITLVVGVLDVPWQVGPTAGQCTLLMFCFEFVKMPQGSFKEVGGGGCQV